MTGRAGRADRAADVKAYALADLAAARAAYHAAIATIDSELAAARATALADLAARAATAHAAARTRAEALAPP